MNGMTLKQVEPIMGFAKGDLEYEKYSKLFFNWFLLIYADQLYALE